MCGIFGYVGAQNAIQIVLKGLKKLEYRGYDSAGVAGIDKNGNILHCKEVGKVAVLEEKVLKEGIECDIAIAHSRWATHGKPTIVNAHPHFDTAHSLAIVHNGIIENYEELRRLLQEKGVKFISETDTEVVAQLIASLYTGDILKAVEQAIPLLEGSYAIALIHRDHPHQIIATANQSPLVIGIGSQEIFISSDSHAFATHTREVIFLTDGEVAVITPDQVEIFDAAMMPLTKTPSLLTGVHEEHSKGDFEHFTLKEIFQQPQTIRNALLSRFLEDYGSVVFDEFNFNVNELQAVERVLILACGTSLHAGYIGAYMLEEKARLPVRVEISSEFRYKNPVIPPGTFVIAISQSGETADTIAAVKEAKEKGAKILAICNVHGSTLVRESDASIFLRAGPEVGVCSTKAFTSQVVVIALLTLMLARMRHMSKPEGQAFLHALQKLPDQVQEVLNHAAHIEAIAKKYASFESVFFLGRHFMYPASLEGALKLKEISYINANGYPAGEMKHGPIALINAKSLVVALCCNQLTFTKMLSNLMELKARGAPILAIAEEGDEDKLDGIADDLILISPTIDELATIPASVAMQLFAYYIALERGADIDHPRNLAKSVTVE